MPKITDEFASAMQQLSAEAEQTIPPRSTAGIGAQGDQPQTVQKLRALDERLEHFEETVAARLKALAEALPSDNFGELTEQLQKMEEQMVALRKTESVNQRLFNSLHEELIKYRDNFLHESLQKPFIRDLVVLFDDLSSLSSQLATAGGSAGKKRAPAAQWSNNLENAIHSLLEILHRLEVKEIEPADTVDRALHRVVSYEPADFAEEDGQIVLRLKRGFLWRDQLLRPEEVVARRFE